MVRPNQPRAGAYSRYSDLKQSPMSMEDQQRGHDEFCAMQGWCKPQRFIDRAITGSVAQSRPGFQDLQTAIRHERIDVLFAESLDRLTRDVEHTASLYKLCQFHCVRIITLQEDEINEMHVGLKGTMNAIFLKDLAHKTKRGLAGRVLNGRCGGGLSYGYTVTVSEADPGGLDIDHAEAAIVREIFCLHAAGKSPKAIAFELNEDGIGGPRSTRWTQSTINGNRKRGTGILNNELYVGQRVWNQLIYVKGPVTEKRLSRLNGEADLVRKAVPELRIINDALWSEVKQRQADLDVKAKPKVRMTSDHSGRHRGRGICSQA